MSEKRRFGSERVRVLVGGAVVAAALAAAGVLGGVGFAGNSVSAGQYQYGKVTICHHTHSVKNPQVTITISLSAWPAHKRRGDTLGPCTTTTTTSASESSVPGNSGEHANSGGNGHGHGHGK